MANTSVQRQELAAKLKEGYKRLRSSEEFADYLATCARFHRYSMSNQMLIWMQRPGATRIAGYKSWQKLGRQVRKGEKGIQIFAPMPWAKKDDAGEVEDSGIYFKAVRVFDVAQTEGDELPSITKELEGQEGSALYGCLFMFAQREGLTVIREHEDPSNHQGYAAASGYYSRSRKLIWVQPNTSQAEATSTLAHELAHHVAGHGEHNETRSEGEVIAESVAFMVLGSKGIDTGQYTYGYLANWANDEEALEKALDRIHEVAGTILDAIA